MRVYVCGSFKFVSIVEEVEAELRRGEVPFLSSKEPDPKGIVGCLEKIDASDALYVVDPKGYIGKSVALDLGYAFAKNKPIYAMEAITDPPLDDLVEDVLTPDALARLLTSSS